MIIRTTFLAALIGLIFASAPAQETRPGPDAGDADSRVRVVGIGAAGNQAPLEGSLAALKVSQDVKSISVGDRTLPLADVLQIQFLQASPPATARSSPVILMLRGGEEVSGTLQSGDENEIVLRSVSIGARREAGPAPSPPPPPGAAEQALQDLHIPIENVHALLIPSQFTSEESRMRFKKSLAPGGRGGPIRLESAGFRAEAAGLRAEGAGPEKDGGALPGKAAPKKDVLRAVDGTRLEGVLGHIDVDGVHFQADAVGNVKLPLVKVQSVVLAELEADRRDSQPGGARAGQPAGSRPPQAFYFSDQTVIAGEIVRLDPRSEPGRLRIRSASLGEIAASLPHLQSIEFQGGRCVYLSDLDPSRATQKPGLFTPRPVQRDANVLGGPLALRGQTFRKGLGMISHARLEYRLSGEFTRFQATLGVDDAARPETIEAERNGGGHALFRIWIDEKPVFEKELSFRDPPVPIDLPLNGAAVLAIETDYGRGFLVLDYADWADARVIRK